MKIAFYKGTRPGMQGIYNRLVRFVDNGPYSHCEIIFSDGVSGSASFIDKGVRFKTIEYSPDNWDFIDLPDYLEPAAREFFNERIGKGYDLMGNLRFIAWMVKESSKDWYCNEICGAAIGQTEPWRHGPNGFYGYCKDFARIHGLAQ